MAWMAWTTPSALFFIGIALILLTMTIAEIKAPCIERKGFLPISTTRGDRLFIGLLSSAYIHLGFVGLTELSIWVPFESGLLKFACLGSNPSFTDSRDHKTSHEMLHATPGNVLANEKRIYLEYHVYQT